MAVSHRFPAVSLVEVANQGPSRICHSLIVRGPSRGCHLLITRLLPWRVSYYSVFIILIFVLSLIVCESPRWLAYHGRMEEARYTVARLLGHADNPEAPIVLERFGEIADSVAYEKEVSVDKWSAIFANDELGSRRRLLIACSVQFFQQLGGINAII